ncbi:MAG: FIG00483994: hypothetical protein [uncultured Sphingomonadaceae bacterium]|uniref:Uncharacterized protein n=1 Tax=uncultured Sphingomonadaceae bacterium TaxID=169976 RepID=A0A6J4TC34_9SPHN|nr:MAG: FIG00483994: hypothetical protein [uncultured Sphingomonadaceae bacterium]
MLTRGDDYPIHQTAEPIAYAGTDRNFYDRYFFNGYPADPADDRIFALAFGVYPALNIADAHFCWLAGGRQVNLHASRWLGMERMALEVGPIRLAVEEPLRRLRVTVSAPEQGVAADLRFTGRSFPIEEPRFTRRIGPRTLLDYTRLTQNGAYEGWLEVDGARTDVAGFVGTRDRSWGVRPVGARDPQLPAPDAPPQFHWLWAPCIFPDRDLFFHSNDDEHGRPWNRRAVWAPVGAGPEEERAFDAARARLSLRPDTRHAAAAELTLADERGASAVAFEPTADFFMLGLGYGHPTWGHGVNRGELAVEREDFATAELDRAQPHHFHVQALSRVIWRDPDRSERVGRGVLEQLAIGPHAPSGFAGLTDLA